MDAIARDRFARDRFALMLGIAKNAGTDAGCRQARQLAVNVASEAGLSFEEAFARLDEEDQRALGGAAHRPFGAAIDADDGADADAVGAEASPSAANAAITRRMSSNVVIDDAVDEAEADETHLSTEGVEPAIAIAAALAADPSRSDRDIAKEVGCSPTTVGRARVAAGLTRLVRSVRRGGQSYEMAKGSRGSS